MKYADVPASRARWLHDARVWRWEELFLLRVDPRSPSASLQLWEANSFDGIWCTASQLPDIPETRCVWVVLEHERDVETLARLGPGVTRIGIDGARLKHVSLDFRDREGLEWFCWLGRGRVSLPSTLPNLRRLRFREFTHRDGVQQLPSSLPALEELSLGLGRLGGWPVLPAMPSLRTLSLFEGQMRNLGPIGVAETLERLKLVGLGQLSRLDELAALTALRELEISFMPGVSDLSPLTACQSLEYLRIEGSRKIGTLAFLDEMPHLRRVQLFDCAVLDGDMAPLIGRDAYFENRRHYSHTLEQVEVGAPGRDAEPDAKSDALLEVGFELEGELRREFIHRHGQIVAAARDAFDCEAGRLYASHHIAELTEADWDGGAPTTREEVWALLRLRSVRSGDGVTLDFTLGTDRTDYVLAVTFDGAWTVVGVSMES